MRVELQQFNKSDVERLLRWIKSPEFLVQWSGHGYIYPLNREQVEKHLRKASAKDPSVMVFKVVDRDTGETVGYLELLQIDREHKSARIGCLLVGPEEMRGKGIGGQVISEILEIAFDRMNLHRVDLGVYDLNESAILCYKKAGFKVEGLMRDVTRRRDNYWNVYIMSILEDEWRAKGGKGDNCEIEKN